MIKRTIDVSEQAYLHMKQKQLHLDKKGELVASIPIEDIGVLILQHPAIVITQAAIIACQQNKVVIVFCDAQHLPYSILLPISDGHTLHTKVLRQQTKISRSTRKRLWKQIVQEKIHQQAVVLGQAGVADQVLTRMVKKVKSGDSENHEAQAAQHYWRKLMGSNFRRNRNANGVNALLNYGYSIMRAMVARALVGSGLHPALGIHHRNQYNGLCLADDLMEPLRPQVDKAVFEYSQITQSPEICRTSKRRLLGLLNATVSWNNRTMPLMVASHYLAANLKSAITGETKLLIFPKWCIDGQ